LPKELKDYVPASKAKNISIKIRHIINDKKYFSKLYPDLDLKKELLNILDSYKYHESLRKIKCAKILDKKKEEYKL
tara:strand:+ start:340 stop:567 length:228 start_codon:yes stop_codon:yes gene_type:complete